MCTPVYRILLYINFTENPCILVHPHPKAKSGKFDCTTMNLSVLLDYRTEDNKEGTFEVSLFAELFNEMMMRDSGYQIYRVICDPERAWKPSNTMKDSKDGKESALGKHILYLLALFESTDMPLGQPFVKREACF